ncbi:MAG: hypothetical protein IJP17_07695, partial [Clostridia bacterium]|nr:hypothetical protein [Clostridia bacterium]
GVDVTLGSGPDIPLRVTVKEYTPSAGPKKKCYVFYSLGNLFSDTSSGADQKEQESMVVKFKLSRAAGSGTVTIASANYYPVFINRDEKYASENTYLKYRVVPASLYVDAESLPSVFSTEAQWKKCKTAFTDIRTLVGDKLVLGTVKTASDDTAIVDNSGGGDNTNI